MFGPSRKKPSPAKGKARKRNKGDLLLIAEVLLLFAAIGLAAAQLELPAVSVALLAALLTIGHVMMLRFSEEPEEEESAAVAPLVDFSEVVRGADSVDGLYRSLIGIVREHFATDAVSLFLRDDDSGGYVCRYSTALPPVYSGKAPDPPVLPGDAFVVRRLQGLTTPLQLEEKELKTWADSLSTLPAAAQQRRRMEQTTLERTRSSILVQLRTKNELMGVLTLGSGMDRRVFTDEQRELLKGVAGQLALVLENARLLDRMLEHERLKHELALAAEVQRSLLPAQTPHLRDAELCGYCQPARQVGGDYYDFIALAEDVAGVAVADVAGKGISAALLMSVVQASLRGQLVNGARRKSLREMVTVMNRLLCGSVSSARYVTFFYAQIDSHENLLTFVNAGHNPPLLYRPPANRLTLGDGEFQSLSAGGPVLGVLSGAGYEEEKVALRPGDLLVAYTDGVTEAMNPGGEEFGEDRLRESICAAANRTAKEILDSVISTVTTFVKGARQHDDLTLVVLKKA